MRAVDVRNETWAEVCRRVTGLRQRVYGVLLREGPMTTRELAAASGIDILTVRPRVTELMEIGLVKIRGKRRCEGMYEAVALNEAKEDYETRQVGEKTAEQMRLF